jgi:cysteine-rich repeat protein
MCAMALGLAVGVPSFELMERVLLNEEQGVRSFISEPLTLSPEIALPRTDLISYLSRSPEVQGVSRAIKALSEGTSQSEHVTISLAPHEPSRETTRLIRTGPNVILVAEIPGGKIFQHVDPIEHAADAVEELWKTLIAESDPNQRNVLFDRIVAAAGPIYVLHEDGVVRRIPPSTPFSRILNRKAPVAAVVSAEIFDTYTNPGSSLLVAETLQDFARLRLNDNGELTLSPLRDFIPGYDPEPSYAEVKLVNPEAFFIFPLSSKELSKPAGELCFDGFDNDDDGAVDCADTLCEKVPECAAILQAKTFRGSSVNTYGALASASENHSDWSEGSSSSADSEGTSPRCGDTTVDSGEECDDGNSENGDGCTKECIKECDVAVESVVSTELDMKKDGGMFAITSTDPFDNSASHCDIVTVSFTTPVLTFKPARNALGGTIGNPKFSHKTVSNKEITATLSGLLWYGYGDGLSSCVPEVGGSDGHYSFEVTVDLKNGTTKTERTEAFIGYGSGAGTAETTISHGRAISIRGLPGYPRKKAVGWECCVAVEADQSDSLVSIKSTVVEEHPKELQYASLVNGEEEFHARQSNSEVDWGQGGFKKNGVRLDSDAEILRRYGLKRQCAVARVEKYEKGIACMMARERAYKEAFTIGQRMLSDLKHWRRVNHFGNVAKMGSVSCHQEYQAKKAVGLTRDKVGLDYKCGYELPAGCPNPAPVPPYFWEFIGR